MGLSRLRCYIESKILGLGKYFDLFAKKVGIVAKNVLVVMHISQLNKVWKNWELIKLGQLVYKNKTWFEETLQ